MKWYIGQPIVAIRNHSQCAFKKGQEFTIKSLSINPCCGYVVINVGISSYNKTARCSCGGLYTTHTLGIHWFNENMFAPLDVGISELTEILTKENQLTKQ